MAELRTDELGAPKIVDRAIFQAVASVPFTNVSGRSRRMLGGSMGPPVVDQPRRPRLAITCGSAWHMRSPALFGCLPEASTTNALAKAAAQA